MEKDYENILEEEVSTANYQNLISFIDLTLADIDNSDYSDEDKEQMTEIVRAKLREF